MLRRGSALEKCGGGERRVRDSPCSAGNSLLAGLALPDSDGFALHSVLAAEGTGVSGVLGNFHLLDLFTERGTVSEKGDILTFDTGRLGPMVETDREDGLPNWDWNSRVEFT